MATTFQVFAITIGFGVVVGGLGVWAAIASRAEERKKQR